MTSDIEKYDNMFNNDWENISGLTKEQIREITIRAYIARDKKNNSYSSAREQYTQLCKLIRHYPTVKTSNRFNLLFRAYNMAEFYDLLSLEELECLGW
jgi:hypothetical protein